jgi:hypothetical protein
MIIMKTSISKFQAALLVIGAMVQPAIAKAAPACFQVQINPVDAQSTVMIAIVPIHIGQSRYRMVVEGSGVVLAGSRQIVTAAHVADSVRRGGYITEVFNNQGKFIGFANLVSQKNPVSGSDYTGPVSGDVAFLKIASVSGGAARARFHEIPGVVLAQHQVAPISVLKTGYYMSGDGMSGGGIFNPNGHLAGIVLAGGRSIPGLPSIPSSIQSVSVTTFRIESRISQSARVSTTHKQAHPRYMIGTNVSATANLQTMAGSTFVLAGYPDLSCSGGVATGVAAWPGSMTELASGDVRITP